MQCRCSAAQLTTEPEQEGGKKRTCFSYRQLCGIFTVSEQGSEERKSNWFKSKGTMRVFE